MTQRQSRNGLGVVILAMLMQAGALLNMWLTAPMMADAVGPIVYGFAFLMTALTILVVTYIFDDESFRPVGELQKSGRRSAAPGQPMVEEAASTPEFNAVAVKDQA